MKSVSGRCANLVVNGHLLSVSSCSAVIVLYRESSVQRKFSDRPVTLSVMRVSSESTIGLTLRLCGAIGVITTLPDRGEMIGPPQLSEYPVEPVGVDTMSPSAQ